MSPEDSVGPVLHAGDAADAVVAAIRARNEGVIVENRGAYVRVLVRGKCLLVRDEVERAGLAPFRLPGDLERIMPAFRGRLTLTEDEASWEMPRPRSEIA